MVMNGYRGVVRGMMIGLGLLAGACGKIPEAYRGRFVDEGSGFVLELGANSGALTQGEAIWRYLGLVVWPRG